MIAFALDANLLVLDEPTSGLDPIFEEKRFKFKRRGKK